MVFFLTLIFKSLENGVFLVDSLVDRFKKTILPLPDPFRYLLFTWNVDWEKKVEALAVKCDSDKKTSTEKKIMNSIILIRSFFFLNVQ